MLANNFSNSITAALIVWLLSLMSAISSANERSPAPPPCLIQEYQGWFYHANSFHRLHYKLSEVLKTADILPNFYKNSDFIPL